MIKNKIGWINERIEPKGYIIVAHMISNKRYYMLLDKENYKIITAYRNIDRLESKIFKGGII